VEFININSKIDKLNSCEVEDFIDANASFRHFTLGIEIERFRHIADLDITLDHPVTLLAGTNKVGKTSILLLLACSHEKFMRLDASKPEPTWREHGWKDVLAFTSYENEANDYSYKLKWRLGTKVSTGEGKRLASSKAWSGLGKKAKDRTNAKIKKREVRLIDLERLLPARSFSASLLRKAAAGQNTALSKDIVRAFCYILELPYIETCEILEVAGHVNKRCYLIKAPGSNYSSYSAASGEESLINLLRDILEAPNDSLILIDELEAGFHPSVQRKLAKVICQISWEQKKQFVITTHSSTLIDALPSASRKFIEFHNNQYRCIAGISPQAALSKMDSIGHPLVRLYCEDDLAEFMIRKVTTTISKEYKNFSRLFEIVRSGPANMVKLDYERHRLHFENLRNKVGYCAIFDGDYHDKQGYKDLVGDGEYVYFLTPYVAPERNLGSCFIESYPNQELEAFLEADNHHAFFKKMVEMDLAADIEDAKNKCYGTFESSNAYQDHFSSLKDFLVTTATTFSNSI
jgi:predicted ATPase